MANYKWPNVYPNIKDLSGVVATNSVTSCAYVGEAEFGPINKPTPLTSLRDYTSIFGALNSAKYGYAGYSLAVASESIDSHYFVRVVKAGKEGAHDADDAMYASVKIPVKGNAASKSTGWYVEEIDTVEKEQNASGLFTNENYYVNKVELVNAGSGYAVNDELLIVLDPISATLKVDELEEEYTVESVTISNAGTGYVANDVLMAHFENGTDASFTVVSVGNDGEIDTLQITNSGLSNINITEVVSLTGGTGTDASVALNMINTGKIKKLSLVSGGESVTELENPINLDNSTGTGNGATVNATFTKTDMSNGLIFVANNPNNLQLSVRLIDSTINENIAYAFSTVSYQSTGDNKYKATVNNVNAEVLKDLEVGDTIVISRSNEVNQEGLFDVTEINANAATLSFEYYSTEEPTTLSYGKIAKYPRPNERTIQVDVILKSGRLTQIVETYQYCTLYQAKDNYGNSMFIEDVINYSSDYVKVYVNPNLIDEENVLQVALNTVDTANQLEGGQSGGKPSTNDLCEGWEQFRDRTQVTVSLLLNCGYANKTETSYQNKMIEIAEYRRDCFCLLDIPMSEVEAEDAIDWRKNTLGKTTYRAALSSPWVKTYDSVQGRANFVMCPSAFVAKLIGAAGEPWNAPAGPNRGIISSSTVSPTGLTQSYNAVIGGTLYADNQINCIVRDTGAGYVNWGQRTLQQKPSALDRINVARTVIYIETVLRDAARWHLFENNTAFERMQITLQFSQFLDTVLSADGIAAYKVICDTSNNTPIVIANNQLVIDVILTPVYAAESIILNTTITGADASVDITSSAN